MMPARSSHSSKTPAPWHQRIWQPHPQPFRRVIADWRFLLVLTLLLIFTDWLGRRWVFQSGSLAGTDVLLRSPQPAPAKHCRLVTIDGDEFNKYLGETFDPTKLAAVLNVILQYEPKVLVIDIDTSPPRFKNLVIPPTTSKVVWARVSNHELKIAPREQRRGYLWKEENVLGNRVPQPEYVGTPLFPQDPDSTVRGFQRIVEAGTSPSPSLHWETLRAYCNSGTPDNRDTHQACELVDSKSADTTVKDFFKDWDFPSYPLSDLMSTEANLKPQSEQLGDIVLVGASFSDIHPTHFGSKLGIELTAAAIETELDPSQPAQIYGLIHWLLKIALAIGIAWLNSRLWPLWATAGMLLLLAVVFVASFLGIYYRVFELDFLPFMIGIWIEQLVEAAERTHHQLAA